MALDNFRKIRIQLNKADDPVFHRLVAKEGDLDGRELEVQLTNRHVLENLAGVKLRLFWRHMGLGNQGIEPFEEVSANDGLFKVAYPNSMLNAGKALCSVQIQDGDRITHTRTFTVVVEGNGFNAQAAIASDEYTALNEALIQIGKYQAEIDAIKRNLQSQADALLDNEQAEFNRLQEEYSPLLIGLQEQFDNVMANITADSELIAARTSTATGRSYVTAGNRLDDMESRQVAEDLDTHERSVITLEVKDGRPRLKLEEVENG